MKIKYLFAAILLSICTSSIAQIINEAPYILTIDELKNWTPNGPTADDILIADIPLAEKFINTDTQFNPGLSNNTQIAYLPDGMNNFGNYGQEQAQFNLYNFTNWSYIDKLVWFGGTADQTIQLPSAPWVNAAHKNGVKVLGNIFFAPNVFGGSTATLNNFLEQDGGGEFIVLPIMIEIMEYYKFDGWFINEETNTDAPTAMLMREFTEALTTEVEALGKEVMWYDAMRLNGNVGWQNVLNANNSPFVQDDEDGDPGNGFETRVSSNIFLNFFWNGTSLPTQSKQRASIIGRSEFDVFTGVDVWPGRNQAPFETGGNNWMGWIHENSTTARTSLGLFAPNCVYNSSTYSNFNNDPNDFANFYSEERHMFAGADRNPGLEDASGFKGYSNWIPASSTITEVPFETNFNTGHGFSKFEEGTQVSTSPWHNMNDQDILPTWQFAFSENSDLNATWDFDRAYNGGSSLKVEGNITENEPADLLLYKTKLPVTLDTKIDLIENQQGSQGASTSLVVTFENQAIDEQVFLLPQTQGSFWKGASYALNTFEGEVIATIGVRFESSAGNISDFAVNVGNIKVHTGDFLATTEFDFSLENDVKVLYSKDDVVLNIVWPTQTVLEYTLYTTIGQKIQSGTIDTSNQSNFKLPVENISSGVYLLRLTDGDNEIVKRVLIK